MSNSVAHQERRRQHAARAAKANRIFRSRTWAASPKPRIVNDEFRQTVERMTNCQRTAWARAGYPGKRHRDIEPLWAFASPERVTHLRYPRGSAA